MSQFSNNLVKIDNLSKIWAKEFQNCSQTSLKETEKALNFLLTEKLMGFLS